MTVFSLLQSRPRWSAFLLATFLSLSSSAFADLEARFRTPPDAARPWVYWFWINGNITEEGITADLEAMARAGIGGVLIMEVANRSMAPAGGVDFASPRWRELFRHVVAEARRLNLQVNMNNDAGWCGSGGPWITPPMSMQELVTTSTVVSGPRSLQEKLPRPAHRKKYYRDVMLLAYPTDTSGRDDGISSSQVLNLSKNMGGDGLLNWEVPEGRWKILRVGVTTTGRTNKPSPVSGVGLECDKFRHEAVEFHFDSFLQKLVEDNGADVGKVFTMTHIDSWEVGTQNWTGRMAEEFRKRRGYDLTPWLPALVAGATVGSPEETARFLWDFNRTRSDLNDEQYGGAMRKAAAARNLKLSAEAYGGHTGFLNPLTFAAETDMPVSEFWIGRWNAWHLHTSRLLASVGHVYGKPIIGAESFTAVAENDPFTEHPYTVKSTGDWAFCEGVNLHIFHRSVLHADPHAVPGMSFAAYGWHADRNQTWWENAGTAYIRYLARCQALLQEGQHVADVCRLVADGENYGHLPAMSTLPSQYDPLPPGYDFDYISDKALLELVSVREGRLVTKGGASYRVLQLPNATTMTVELATKVRDLVKDGAIVVGPKPSRAPGLTDYPACDAQLRALAAEVWNDCNGTTVTEHRLGNGRVVWGRSMGQVLAEAAGGPDLQFVLDPPYTPEALHAIRHGRGYGTPREPIGNMPTTGLNWIHRRTAEGDVYFVANPQPREVNAVVTFRNRGKQPELWNPATGEVTDLMVLAAAEQGTRVPLHFDPAGSVFIVFRRESLPKNQQVVEVRRDGTALFSAGQAGPKRVPEIRSAAPGFTMEGAPAGKYELLLADGSRLATTVAAAPASVALQQPWSVSFQPGRGAPATAEYSKLTDWAASPDPGIRHFSGTATYRTTLQKPRDGVAPGSGAVRWYLNLGDVQVVAQVRLNGRDLGVLWRPPFRVDVTEALQDGPNTLEIEVTNLWPNRLIGDEQFPDDCTTGGTWLKGPLPAWPEWVLRKQPRPEPRRLTFTTFKHFTKDSPLLPSGLLGPVALEPQLRWAVEPGRGQEAR